MSKKQPALMKDTAPPTWLERLTVRNFRAFDELTVEFHPHLTVLVAPNGGGKTAVLDAAALSLRYFVDTLLGSRSSHGFERSDVRLERSGTGSMVPMLPVQVEATATIQDRALSWDRELGSLDGRTTRKEAKALSKAADGLLGLLRRSARRQEAPPDLPIIAHYGTGRLWGRPRMSSPVKAGARRLDLATSGYQDALNPASSYGHFAYWFEAVVREAQNEQSGYPSPHRPQVLLEAVRRACDAVLARSGWSRLDFDYLSDEVVAHHDSHGRLPVSFLSDGVRSVLSLVSDLAHRAVRLNPHLGADAAKQTPGIVLIDEVDMHLHPEWQQEVIGSLRDAFPRIQFVITTHSPQVISTVPSECIRILAWNGERYTCRVPSLQTEGVPSSDVLASVMGVDPVPDVAVRRDLDRYRAMIQDGEHDTAGGRELRATLNEHFGQHHPEILDLDRLIRFRAALSRRNSGGQP